MHTTAETAPVEAQEAVASETQAAPNQGTEPTREEAIAAFAKAMAESEREDEAVIAAAAVEPEGAQNVDTSEQVPTDRAQEETKTEEPKQDKFAQRFESLKAEEKRIRQEREELKAIRTELETFRRAQQSAKTNPLQALKDLGLSYEQLTEHVLSGGKPDPMAEVKAQVEALKAEAEANKRAAEQARVEAAVTSFKGQIASTLKAKAETFELAHAHDSEAVDTAYQVIDQYYAETGELPGGSIDAAIEQALTYVEESLEKKAERYISSKKVRAKFAPAGANTTAEAPRPQVSQATQQKPKTLTNSLVSNAPVRKEPDNLTRDELIARAARILAGQTA